MTDEKNTDTIARLERDADPVPYLNAFYKHHHCLPSTWQGKEITALAEELQDLPGLDPDVNTLLKQHS